MIRYFLFSFLLLIASDVFSAMGYLGGYPYTITTAKRKAKFNVPPASPAPNRRSQYAYMAVPIVAPVVETFVESAPEATDEYEKVSESEMEEEVAQSAQEPELGNEVYDEPLVPLDDYSVDWDEL